MSIDEQIERIKTKIADKGLRLNPVAAEGELQALETTYGIDLPEEFRLFYLNIGNGGQGPPCDGLYDLAGIAAAIDDTKLENLHRPFRFEREWIWEDEPQPWSDAMIDRFDLLDDGNLCLGSSPWNITWQLILYGSQAGRVWAFYDDGIRPEEGDDFLSWYEIWLDGRKGR